MNIDIEHFKEKLLKEKAALEKEMALVGRVNPDNPRDWQAVPPADERDASLADENTVADEVEGYQGNVAIIGTLEPRYRDVLSGLDKIEKGTYGICQVCGQEIEADRLEVNPASRTCKSHM